MNNSAAPIGIFDSGIGGLTVARSIRQVLPNEQLIYFGDTAHLPYGDKSTAAIQAYSVKIADFLLGKGCKVIVIACNSASAAAFELVQAYVGSKAKVFNVIDPAVAYIRENYHRKTIGLIGTKQTVLSGVYQKKIAALENEITFQALATPLLVPMIEEGFASNRISAEIIDQYLKSEILAGIEALILGCTHYPLIKNQVEAYYHGKVEVIDSATIIAASLEAFLKYHNLHAKQPAAGAEFFVSDYTTSFEQTTQLFFGKMVKLQKFKLWE